MRTSSNLENQKELRVTAHQAFATDNVAIASRLSLCVFSSRAPPGFLQIVSGGVMLGKHNRFVLDRMFVYSRHHYCR